MSINFSNKKISKKIGGATVKGATVKGKSAVSKPVDTVENESMAEMSEVLQKFSEKGKEEQKKKEENTDCNYFTVVSFNNKEQLQQFFNKVGLMPSDPQYIDGLSLCRKLGINISAPSRPAPVDFKINKRLKDMVM